MYVIGVDLGTTNLKAALYDSSLACVARESEKVIYARAEGFVELDIEQYFDSFCSMIRRLREKSGVPAEEIDETTMELKKVKGLYVCGEIADVDGDCGGYNLQWAFSSGAVAGQSAARSLLGR